MIESSEQRHTIEDDADVDDMKEDENDNSGNVLCDVVMKRCENDLLSAGIMLDAEARVFEREAFYKSALNRYCASLRIFQKLSNPHNIHALRHRIAAHLSVARCTHLCHAQCTWCCSIVSLKSQEYHHSYRSHSYHKKFTRKSTLECAL